MARPIVLSNGELHVGLNKYGLVHDFYFPYVGLENHASGADLRHKIGVYVDGKISWLDDEDQWTFSFKYPHDALIGHTIARSEDLGVVLEFDDAVDAEMSLFMRNIQVINMSDQPREIKLFMYQAFAIGDSRSNTDTAQYLPDSNAVMHYRGRRTFIVSGSQGDKPFDQFTIGLFGIEHHEGTYHDAEDGELGGNDVEHGRVDSVLGFTLNVEGHGSGRVHYWIAAGTSMREALYIHRQMDEDGMSHRMHQTCYWWQKWLEPVKKVQSSVPEEHRDLFLKSVMIIKSQIDKRGAVIASTDSTLLNYSRDNYSYSWPRDGANTVWPLIRLGFYDEAYRFFEFCKRGLHPAGYLMHKYLADGALGSSWHTYVHGETVTPPIQEDETALVVFVFAQFYQIQQDSKLIKEFYSSMIKPMADYMTEFVDDSTGLPKPTYDLWEEVFQTTTYTVSVTYAALLAASELAVVAGDQESAVKWRAAADDIRAASAKHLFNEERQVFYKGIRAYEDGSITKDATIDTSAVFGAFMFGLFDANGDQMKASIESTKKTFGVTDTMHGLPRYENDPYRRADPSISGNWWPITSMWMAQYDLENNDPEHAMKILDWIKGFALTSGMLPEQIDPQTNAIVSPAPLTWSHAEYLSTMLDYIEKTK